MNTAQKLVLGLIRAQIKTRALFSKRKAAEKLFDLFCTPIHRNRKKLPPIFKEAEKITVPFGKYVLKGYRWNRGAAKRIQILHGFESSVINFDRYIRPLIRKGYEVLAFDAPAHGRSTGKRINALVYRDFVKFINAEFGPVQAYMAHSFGGLALCLALEAMPPEPDLRIVLIAPLTESTSSMNTFFQVLNVEEPVRKEFEKIITEQAGHPSSWYSIRRAVKNIQARIRWFHDEDDLLTPLADAVNVKEENHPHIEFIISKGLGHRRIYRDNQVKKAAIDFF